MRKPGRVGWAWIDALVLAVLGGAAGFWLGGGLGAGVGVAAGVVAPVVIERATRRQEAVEGARETAAAARRYGPAHLLEPGLGVVALSGRVAELAVLEAWCLDEAAGLVRLVTGGGGTGKTRLAQELCQRMQRAGWQWARVAEGAEAGVIGRERAAAPGARLLLVADYAEARLGLAGLLEAAARDEGQVRVLLLARQAGAAGSGPGGGAGPGGRGRA